MAKDHNSSQMEAILEFTDKSLQKDKEIVLAAVTQSAANSGNLEYVLEYVDVSLRNDPDILAILN